MSTKITDYGMRKSPRGGYGQYEIYGVVNGIEITAGSDNSKAFDYWNDEEHPEKQEEAIAHILRALELAYSDTLQMTEVYIVEGGGQKAQQMYEMGEAVEYRVDKNDWELRTKSSGQNSYAGPMWSTDLEDLQKWVDEWVGESVELVEIEY